MVSRYKVVVKVIDERGSWPILGIKYSKRGDFYCFVPHFRHLHLSYHTTGESHFKLENSIEWSPYSKPPSSPYIQVSKYEPLPQKGISIRHTFFFPLPLQDIHRCEVSSKSDHTINLNVEGLSGCLNIFIILAEPGNTEIETHLLSIFPSSKVCIIKSTIPWLILCIKFPEKKVVDPAGFEFARRQLS